MRIHFAAALLMLIVIAAGGVAAQDDSHSGHQKSRGEAKRTECDGDKRHLAIHGRLFSERRSGDREGTVRPASVSPAASSTVPGTAEPSAVPEAEPGAESSDEDDAGHADKKHGSSRLSDQPIPLADLPERPKPLLELGTPFLGTGRIGSGFRLPTGAVWQPSFLLFGSFRSGLSYFDDERTGTTQWANRLDLFGNLYLSGTERLVFGLRPLDETAADGTRRFTGARRFSPDPNDRGGGVDGFNFDWDTVTHLFFEGEFGEIFPNLDPEEKGSFDIGFSVGRQPINFQEGLLVNDFLDAVGVTRNNLKPSGTVNMRVTGLYAWNQINRNTPSGRPFIRNLEAEGASLFGLFTEIDWRATTAAFDVIYLNGGTFSGSAGAVADVTAGDAVYAGASFVQRFGALNASFRVLGSIPVGDETPDVNALGISDPAGGGALFFSEISWTPHHSHDFVYINAFAALNEYRAAALDPTIPGPLARAGFLFAGPGLGNFPGALSPTAEDVVGGAVGYQKFLAHTRQQLLLEAGGRVATRDCAGTETVCTGHSLAGGARYQTAIGRRHVLVVDGYLAWEDLRGAARLDFGEDSRLRLGSRIEWLVKF